MKEVTQTYYVCQYCGYTDSDDAAMRRHESICKGKIPMEKLIGKWVKKDDTCFFKITDYKPLSYTVKGIEMSEYSIEEYTHPYTDIINKPVSEKEHLKLWEKWKQIVEGPNNG